MAGGNELLLLRLGLLAVILVFVLFTAITLRSGLRPAVARPAARPRPASAQRPVGPRFVVLSPGATGLAAGEQIAVAGEMSMGRDPTNGIVLGDSSVSGVHANLVRARDGWRLTDLGSTNGTTVNGRQVDGRGASLKGGELVGLGAVMLRFDS